MKNFSTKIFAIMAVFFGSSWHIMPALVNGFFLSSLLFQPKSLSLVGWFWFSTALFLFHVVYFYGIKFFPSRFFTSHWFAGSFTDYLLFSFSSFDNFRLFLQFNAVVGLGFDLAWIHLAPELRAESGDQPSGMDEGELDVLKNMLTNGKSYRNGIYVVELAHRFGVDEDDLGEIEAIQENIREYERFESDLLDDPKIDSRFKVAYKFYMDQYTQLQTMGIFELDIIFDQKDSTPDPIYNYMVQQVLDDKYLSVIYAAINLKFDQYDYFITYASVLVYLLESNGDKPLVDSIDKLTIDQLGEKNLVSEELIHDYYALYEAKENIEQTIDYLNPLDRQVVVKYTSLYEYISYLDQVEKSQVDSILTVKPLFYRYAKTPIELSLVFDESSDEFTLYSKLAKDYADREFISKQKIVNSLKSFD